MEQKIISKIEEISGRTIIERIETAQLWDSENIRFENVLVKIDTGAWTSSIDFNLASRMGYSKIIELYKSVKHDDISTFEEGNKIAQELQDKYKNEHHLLDQFKPVRSSHGYSIRPIIWIKVTIGGRKIHTRANVFNRSHMSYPMIIGNRTLKGKFLVAP